MAQQELQKQHEGKLEKNNSQQVQTIRPVGNICEEDGKVVLRLEMPGVTRDQVDIRIENDHLIVQGERGELSDDGKYLVRERRHGNFYQRYTLDDTVDREKIDARMDKGVLTVTLDLKDSVKPRKIQIKTK